MKITEKQLQQIIKEEIEKNIEEGLLDKMRAGFAKGSAQGGAIRRNVGRLGRKLGAELGGEEFDPGAGPERIGQAGAQAATSKLAQISSKRILKHSAKLYKAMEKVKRELVNDMKDMKLLDNEETKQTVDTIVKSIKHIQKVQQARFKSIAATLVKIGEMEYDTAGEVEAGLEAGRKRRDEMEYDTAETAAAGLESGRKGKRRSQDTAEEFDRRIAAAAMKGA